MNLLYRDYPTNVSWLIFTIARPKPLCRLSRAWGEEDESLVCLFEDPRSVEICCQRDLTDLPSSLRESSESTACQTLENVTSPHHQQATRQP